MKQLSELCLKTGNKVITFYPHHIPLWEDHFDFHPPITLTPKEKTDHQGFRNRAELIEFLKGHGVPLDDPELPLYFEADPTFDRGCGDPFIVIQWSVLGWFRDDYK